MRPGPELTQVEQPFIGQLVGMGWVLWQRVARALPEYEQRKAWLAEHGGQHVVL